MLSEYYVKPQIVTLHNIVWRVKYNGHAPWKLFGKGSDDLTSSNRSVINIPPIYLHLIFHILQFVISSLMNLIQDHWFLQAKAGRKIQRLDRQNGPLQRSTTSSNFDGRGVLWYFQIWLWKYFGPILGKTRPRWLVFDAFAANAFWWQKTASVFGSRADYGHPIKSFFKNIPNFWANRINRPNKLQTFWGILTIYGRTKYQHPFWHCEFLVHVFHHSILFSTKHFALQT